MRPVYIDVAACRLSVPIATGLGAAGHNGTALPEPSPATLFLSHNNMLLLFIIEKIKPLFVSCLTDQVCPISIVEKIRYKASSSSLTHHVGQFFKLS